MLRREHPEWFGAEASYDPLAASGPKAAHAVAYLRAGRVATLVPRWPLKLGESWAGTTLALPEGRWTNVLTGDVVDGGRLRGNLRVQALLRDFPVALLVRNSE
jgi:(1->4)-alpha-D-glucan 1-alpha-D-glucosylmutase